MPRHDSIQKRREELADRQWPVADIEPSFNRLVQNGIPSQILNRGKMLREKVLWVPLSIDGGASWFN